MFASDSVVWAPWRYMAEELHSLRYTNEVVAAYVACGGRMNFYAYLDKIGESELCIATHIRADGLRTASDRIW